MSFGTLKLPCQKPEASPVPLSVKLLKNEQKWKMSKLIKTQETWILQDTAVLDNVFRLKHRGSLRTSIANNCFPPKV